MVQNNKILTVSYGTFSCTLEGFDDSFETMKAIAEYFRDLAADDRYFGSEPPQPDTEMLTRIAQRDASRKVEASQSDAGLLIRATENTSAPSQPAASAPDLNVVAKPNTTPPSQAPQAFFADAEPVEDAPNAAADSIAAKLQRIRAVVSHSEENSVIYTEDEETALMKSTAGPSDAVAAAFAAGSLAPDDLNDAEEPAAEPEVQVEEPAAEPEMAEALSEPEMEEALSEPEQPEVQEDQEPELEAPLTLDSASLIPAVEGVEEETPVTDDDEAVEEDIDLSGVLFSDLDDAAENEPEDEEVVNILSEERAEEEIDQFEDESDDIDTGILTEEDEVNLLSEISSVEAVLASRAAGMASDEPDLDQDASRLMDKIGEQLDDPDASNKRETYTHLRAAVAATEAERKDAGKAARDTEGKGFNDDLTSAVSPRRPEVQVTSARPETAASAPLKLVAEQRIDNQDKDAGPITPRRVKTEAEDEAVEEEGGFAMFAQEQGAQSLPDLLEAAAAYLSFIEGQEQFSRPQLMNKIRSLKQDDFNREESLRSFGQLLRDGKIEKAGGGRFAASTQIGFRPDDERAAG